MHVGLVMECDYREGRTQEEAFAEALSIADLAEASGLDGVWLAERHFAAPRRPTDPGGAGIPSIASVPLVLAAAIAARTKRVRIGTGVSVLPLCHPIRTAEEAATVDQLSLGRLDFGVGRSGFPRAYAGYGIPYGESRDRFQESLDVILKAWTQERFSHSGKYFTFNDMIVVPRPYQKPHPPIWMAATTQDTFPLVGAMGLSLVTGLRGFDVPEATGHLAAYRAARRAAGPCRRRERLPPHAHLRRGDRRAGALGAGREHDAVLSPSVREPGGVSGRSGHDRLRGARGARRTPFARDLRRAAARSTGVRHAGHGGRAARRSGGTSSASPG